MNLGEVFDVADILENVHRVHQLLDGIARQPEEPSYQLPTEQQSLTTIDHVTEWSDDFRKLLQDKELSDVDFIVGSQRFCCSKMFLSVRSDVFRNILSSEPEQSEFNLEGTSAEAFQAFLDYVHSGKLDMTKLKLPMVVRVEELANKYGFRELEKDIEDYVKNKGQIDHFSKLYEDVGRLLLNTAFSDVTLLVENESFPAHKLVLAARCEYFRAMFFHGMRESSKSKIELVDTPSVAFKALLTYIYTGKVTLLDMELIDVVDLLGLANKYAHKELEHGIGLYLKGVLDSENLCLILTAATVYSIPELADMCLDRIDSTVERLFASEDFRYLQPESVKMIVARDSLCASESQVFQAVKVWVEANSHLPKAELKEVLQQVRLSEIGESELAKFEEQVDLLTDEEEADIHRKRDLLAFYRFPGKLSHRFMFTTRVHFSAS
uniref:BTB domain-containing protein n=1 Tax=Steinernema glaseri TaxID=37863 RepID=A0A1I7Z0T2_9BILA